MKLFTTIVALVGIVSAQSNDVKLSTDEQVKLDDFINGIKNGTYNSTDIKSLWLDLEDEKKAYRRARFSQKEKATCIENDECESECCVAPRGKGGKKGMKGRGGKGGPGGRRSLSDDDDVEEDEKTKMRRGSFGGRGKGTRGRVCMPQVSCDRAAASSRMSGFIAGICIIFACLCFCVLGQYCYFKKRMDHLQATGPVQDDIQLGHAVPIAT